MNQNAASSTVSPTVNSPWFWWIAALPFGNAAANSLAGLDLEHDRAAVLGDQRVVVVEDAGVLRERGERDAERAERLAVRRVRVGGGDHVGAGRVDRRVQHERRPVDRLGAVHDVALVVDEDQVALADVAEAHAERVDPEVVGELGVAHRDVAGDALGEPEPAEHAQRTGEVRLAVVALLLDGVERRQARRARRPSGSVRSRRSSRVTVTVSCSVMAMTAERNPQPTIRSMPEISPVDHRRPRRELRPRHRSPSRRRGGCTRPAWSRSPPTGRRPTTSAIRPSSSGRTSRRCSREAGMVAVRHRVDHDVRGRRRAARAGDGGPRPGARRAPVGIDAGHRARPRPPRVARRDRDRRRGVIGVGRRVMPASPSRPAVADRPAGRPARGGGSARWWSSG